MNEFTAKKLGEVLAFSEAGKAIFEKGKGALVTLFGHDFDANIESFIAQAEKIKSFAEDNNLTEVTIPKSEKTNAKLMSMAETYIGDEWDNPAELLEWLGFFEGAAVIHWRLVLGSGRGASNESLTLLAKEGVNLHSTLLAKVGDLIESLAQEKTS